MSIALQAVATAVLVAAAAAYAVVNAVRSAKGSTCNGCATRDEAGQAGDPPEPEAGARRPYVSGPRAYSACSSCAGCSSSGGSSSGGSSCGGSTGACPSRTPSAGPS